jgi:hypothetical protein
VKAIVWFCVRFLLIAPICLILWWQALPVYVWSLGHIAGIVASPFLSSPVESVSVVRGGVLNTGATLNVVLGGHTKSMPIAELVSNSALFVALVLATGGMGLRRRLASLALGCAILSLGHGVYIALALVFADSMRHLVDVPTALAQLFITLPFLLWIVLAYWEHVVELITPNAGADAPEPGPRADDQ